MSSRYQDIIDRAVSLFNERGFYNVSLKNIAAEMDISPGNITYHFPKKENLLAAIQEQIIENGRIELIPKGTFITLNRFKEISEFYQNNQIRYQFYFNNLTYLFHSYPEMSAAYQEITLERFTKGRELITFFVQTGRLLPESEGVNYNSLIQTFITLSIFWTAQRSVIPEHLSADNQMDLLWDLLIPYMTDKGKAEHREILIQQSITNN